jgi:hypothetical protein
MRGIAVIVSLLIAGCSNPGHTKKDALIGGGSGLSIPIELSTEVPIEFSSLR